MSKFKDRLWQELMRKHGAELAQMDGPEASRSRRARPRVLAGTSLGIAGIGAALALVLSAAGSSPAFAVTKNSDGTVSVTIRKLDGIRGANARLAAIGVQAVAVPVEAGCAVGPPPPGLRAALLKARAIAAAGGPRTVQINPNGIPPGKRLVLAAGANWVRVAQLHGAERAAPPCFRDIVAPAWCRGAAVPSGPGGVMTDTTGTDTAPPPPTNTNTNTNTTTTGTTTTGTTSGPVAGPPARFAGCAPPPCASVHGRVQVVPPGGPPTNTNTTGTTTAPPTNTTTTGTTTTGTGTGQVTAPAPFERKFFGCPMPCASGQVASAGPPRSAITSDRAELAKMRAALTRTRAALAKARAAQAKASGAANAKP